VAYPGIATLFVTAVTLMGVLGGNWIADLLIRSVPLLHDQSAGDRILFKLGLNVLGGLIGFLIGLSSFNKLMRVVRHFEGVALLDKVAVILGIIVGLAVAMLATIPFATIPGVGMPLRFAAGIVGLLFGIGFTMSAKQQIAHIFPQLGAHGLVGTGSALPLGSKLLDTNIIIDGRIADICRTGFLAGPVYVPGWWHSFCHGTNR
jgi:uncharacterized protein YacL